MTVVDAHCHIYPPAIAKKAVESVGDFYAISMDEPDGSPDALIAACADSPITHQVVYSVALKASQVESINSFIAEQCKLHPSFIGLATLHQDYAHPEQEIDRALELGLHGIKLHPDSQAVNMDDPRLMTIYELCEAKKLPVVIHCGDYRYDYSHPRRLVEVLHTFPQLRVDAAHFGGWSVWDLAVEYIEHENCFMDISSSQEFLGPRRAAELIRLYGPDRILFGSDFPMWSPKREYELFTALDFTEAEFEAMLHHNAERFLGVAIS